MNIQFKPNGTKDIQKIYIRVYANRLDLSVCTELSVLKSDWDAETESSKTDLQLNENLLKLKLEVLKQFNYNLTKGLIINTIWLKNVVKTTFDRPIQEVGLVNSDYSIYFSSFSTWWMDNYSSKWKTSARKNMSSVLISQYNSFIEIFKNYELQANKRIELRLLTQEEIYCFIEYLQDLDYSVSTRKRILGRLRFFCIRSKDIKLDVCSDHSLKFYFDQEEEIDGVYLSEEEIQVIYDLDLTENYLLDNVRDNLIISCRTSLRISDFMTNLKTDNIKDGIISIKTQKTGAFVKLPIHNQVKTILDKRFGQLPNKISFSDYNKQIKEVCRIAKIDTITYGKVFCSKTQRKKLGYYPKSDLVTSHIGRRSFISNLRGKISDDALAKLGGWTTTKLLETYNKTSKLDYANTLNEFWNNQ